MSCIAILENRSSMYPLSILTFNILMFNFLIRLPLQAIIVPKEAQPTLKRVRSLPLNLFALPREAATF